MPNSTNRGPVVVRLNVEGFGDSATDEYEVDRAEWDAMNPADRAAMLDEVATSHANDHVSWGWRIDDPDDLAETT